MGAVHSIIFDRHKRFCLPIDVCFAPATVLQLPAAAVDTQGSEGSSVRLTEGLSAECTLVPAIAASSRTCRFLCPYRPPMAPKLTLSAMIDVVLTDINLGGSTSGM